MLMLWLRTCLRHKAAVWFGFWIIIIIILKKTDQMWPKKHHPFNSPFTFVMLDHCSANKRQVHYVFPTTSCNKLHTLSVFGAFTWATKQSIQCHSQKNPFIPIKPWQYNYLTALVLALFHRGSYFSQHTLQLMCISFSARMHLHVVF